MRVLVQLKDKDGSRPRGGRFRRGARWLFGVVLALDVVVALVVLPPSLDLVPALAQATPESAATSDPEAYTLDALRLLGKELDARTEELLIREEQLAGSDRASGAESLETADAPGADTSSYSPTSLRMLGAQMVARAEELRRREAALEEARRAEAVLRLSGIEQEEPAAEEQATADTVDAPDPGLERAREAFVQLQKAYEKMEPESAALALSQLAARDREAVIALLEGWQARTSGAILDALTQSDPALAADLSYEIYRRGKPTDDGGNP